MSERENESSNSISEENFVGRGIVRVSIDPFFYTMPENALEEAGGGVDPFDHSAQENVEEEESCESGIDPFFYTMPENAMEEAGRGIDPFDYIILEDVGKKEAVKVVIDPFEHFEPCETSEKNVQEDGCGKGGDKEKEAKTPQKEAGTFVKVDETTATNFLVRPLRRYIFIDRMGLEDSEKAVIESVVEICGTWHRIDVRVKDIHSLARTIQKKFPEAILDFEHKNVERVIEMQYRRQIPNCRKINVYFQAGWQRIGRNMRYLRDDMQLGEDVCVSTGMTLPALPSYGCEELLSVFDRAMTVCRDKATISVLFTFSLTGILYHLFHSAGFEPHFCLFLYGVTGSMKTTIGKIFFTQLCQERYRENVRRIDMDTAVSLERAIVTAGHDTVTLIDDFSPAKTVTKKREMAEKLEMIIRMVGDGSSRSRSSLKLEDLRGEGVQGMVALTGELTGKGLSSNLRCVYCKLEKKTVDVKEVTWFQKNPYAYSSLLAAFADYVAEKYEIIIEDIRREVNVQREKISQFVRERRLIDSAVVLCIAAKIFAEFMSEKLGQSAQIAEARRESLKAGIIEIIIKSQALTEEESPGIEFVKAIAALIRMNLIVLNKTKVRLTGSTIYDGYEDEDYFYFNPESVHKKVLLFFKQTNRYFPYDLKEIMAILADEGIIKPASNGTGKRTYCVRIKIDTGAKYNFLRIKKATFEKVCSEYFEDEN